VKDYESCRHEIRYHINRAEYKSLREQLEAITVPNGPITDHGASPMHVVFFSGDRSHYEQFFIVCSDHFNKIYLEKKSRWNDLTTATLAELSVFEFRKIMHSDYDFMKHHSSKLVREFYKKLSKDQLFRNRSMSYEREWFLSEGGKAEITFDASDCLGDLVLVVRYEGYLPQELVDILATEERIHSALAVVGA